MNAVCVECSRRFDLSDETQADEWYNGHDCEEDTTDAGAMFVDGVFVARVTHIDLTA